MKKQGAPRRDRFPREYLVDFNATKAAQRCGYSKKTAYAQGHRLLKNAEIQKALLALQKTRADKHEETFDKWMTELMLVAHSDLKNYISIDDGGLMIAKTFEEMPKETSRALEAIEENRTIKESADGDESNIINSKIKFKTHSKISALELIGKSLGYLKDKISAPELEDALNRNSMTIDGLRKSLAGYKKAKA